MEIEYIKKRVFGKDITNKILINKLNVSKALNYSKKDGCKITKNTSLDNKSCLTKNSLLKISNTNSRCLRKIKKKVPINIIKKKSNKRTLTIVKKSKVKILNDNYKNKQSYSKPSKYNYFNLHNLTDRQLYLNFKHQNNYNYLNLILDSENDNEDTSNILEDLTFKQLNDLNSSSKFFNLNNNQFQNSCLNLNGNILQTFNVNNNYDNNYNYYYTRSYKKSTYSNSYNFNYNNISNEFILYDREKQYEVPEYLNQIFLNLVLTEKSNPQCNSFTDYMKHQLSLNDKSRFYAVDWIAKQYTKNKLLQETFILSVNILDRYLNLIPIKDKEIKLLAVTSLFIASKYEEIYPDDINSLVKASYNEFSKEEILKMEIQILSTLNYDINNFSPLRFLESYLLLCRINKDSYTYKLSLFLLDACMFSYRILKFKASNLAAAIVYLALNLSINNRDINNNNTINVNKNIIKKSSNIFKDDYSLNTNCSTCYNSSSKKINNNNKNLFIAAKNHLLLIYNDVYNSYNKININTCYIKSIEQVVIEIKNSVYLLKFSKSKGLFNKYKNLDYNNIIL